MKITLKTLGLITTLSAAVVVGGCKNSGSGSQTGGAISPTPLPAKTTSKVPKNYVRLGGGVPVRAPVSAIVAAGGDVDVRDEETNQSIWMGRVQPNTVITVAARGVQIGGLQKTALKNGSNKHVIYFVRPQ